MPNLYGTILGPDLEPVTEDTVVRFTRNQEVGASGVSVLSGGRVETETDANGRFGPVALGAGKWIVEWLTTYHQNRREFTMPVAPTNFELGYLIFDGDAGARFDGSVLTLLNVDTGEWHPVDIDDDGAFRIYSPDTVLPFANYDIETATDTFRIRNPDGTAYPITWSGDVGADGTLEIGAADGTEAGNYILSQWLEIVNPDEVTKPWRKLFLVGARDSATWALGHASTGAEGGGDAEIIPAGQDPTVDTLTMRWNGHTYRQKIIGETEEGVPLVQWQKIS